MDADAAVAAMKEAWAAMAEAIQSIWGAVRAIVVPLFMSLRKWRQKVMAIAAPTRWFRKKRTVPPEQRQPRPRVVRIKPDKLPVWARIDPSIPLGTPGTGWRPEEIAAIKEARSPAEAVTLYLRAFPTSPRGKGGIYEAFKRMGFGWRS